MRIRVVGHSTVLFEVAGLRILTDPFFGLWGNPAYKRIEAPALRREELADVDAVLVSHNHWDHTDRKFFRLLPDTVPVLAPRRAAWVTALKGARGVWGIRPWETWRMGNLRVTAVPALHPATTIGYVLESDTGTAYFAGDTYLRPFMAEIGARFRLDVALLPVTTYRIPMTMGERSAVEAVRALGVSEVIPIHLGLQPRSPLLRTRHSPEGFARRVAEAGLPCRVVVLPPGGVWHGGSRQASASPRD